jgi:ubiquinone/menaquinone biosynthesis C-methylase UbiE
MDPQTILCTTYQMRNFYRQFGDGFFSSLDVMNYIQHHQIVKWCQAGWHILDVCCGRGLLLPMLRYQRKTLGSYTGVDIRPGNAIWQTKRVTNGKPIDEDYYPFPTRFVEANVAEMSQHLEGNFDAIIYTSSIEHMHRDMGLASLVECRKVAKDGALLVITCPNTPEDQDGYDTQYASHVYEWKRSELLEGLRMAGFTVINEWGLLISKTELKRQAEHLWLLPLIQRLEQFIPSEWLCPMMAVMFPEQSKEIGMVARAG